MKYGGRDELNFKIIRARFCFALRCVGEFFLTNFVQRRKKKIIKGFRKFAAALPALTSDLAFGRGVV